MAATGTAVGAWGQRARVDTVGDASLARAAAAGDAAAFATLYERHESGIFNFCHRLLGSRDDAADATRDAFVDLLARPHELEDRELNLWADLFVAARKASHEIAGRRGLAEPTEEPPHPSAAPDPGDPGRAGMLASLQHDVRAANGRLPERQREILALLELEGLSYDEIADVMEMDRNSVAQLSARARIGLRDELRDSALAAVAGASPECERALSLIAARQDGQLDDAGERTWLTDHLATCETCDVAQEAIQEAGISYRAWVPVMPVPWLKRATAARAAALTGVDRSDIAGGLPGHGGRGPVAGGTAGDVAAAAPAARGGRVLAGGLLALLLLLGFSTAVAIGTDGAPQRLFSRAGGSSLAAQPAAGAAVGAAGPASAPRKRRERASAHPGLVATTTSTAVPSVAETGTPRHRASHRPRGGGNSTGGGRRRGAGSTPTTTPTPPAPPTPPAGSTPSSGGTPAGGDGGDSGTAPSHPGGAPGAGQQPGVAPSPR